MTCATYCKEVRTRGVGASIQLMFNPGSFVLQASDDETRLLVLQLAGVGEGDDAIAVS